MAGRGKWIRAWGRIGVALCLLFFGFSFQAYGTKQDVDAAKQEASALEEEKERMEQTLKGLEGQKADTAEYVHQLDLNLEAISQELEILGGQVSAKEAEIQITKEQLEEARQTEERQYASMKLRIKYMYEKGDTSFFTLLMESRDFAELLNRAEYISKISEYDREQLNQYAATKEAVAAHEQTLEAEHQEFLALQDKAQAKEASVEQLLEAKQQELKNYEARIASAQEQIDQYQKDLAAQEARIKALEEEIRRKEEEERKRAQEAGKSYTTANLGNIKFIWPCPSSGRITSGFGERSSPIEGASTSHQGIDIGAGTGSDVLAAASGTVTIATYSYSAGNYVMISHGGGVFTVYMHCSKLNVSAGQAVQQGQVIGAVGSTGYSTGPHLHFGIRSGGAYVNPAQYVSP